MLPLGTPTVAALSRLPPAIKRACSKCYARNRALSVNPVDEFNEELERVFGSRPPTSHQSVPSPDSTFPSAEPVRTADIPRQVDQRASEEGHQRPKPSNDQGVVTVAHRLKSESLSSLQAFAALLLRVDFLEERGLFPAAQALRLRSLTLRKHEPLLILSLAYPNDHDRFGKRAQELLDAE